MGIQLSIEERARHHNLRHHHRQNNGASPRDPRSNGRKFFHLQPVHMRRRRNHHEMEANDVEEVIIEKYRVKKVHRAGRAGDEQADRLDECEPSDISDAPQATCVERLFCPSRIVRLSWKHEKNRRLQRPCPRRDVEIVDIGYYDEEDDSARYPQARRAIRERENVDDGHRTRSELPAIKESSQNQIARYDEPRKADREMSLAKQKEYERERPKRRDVSQKLAVVDSLDNRGRYPENGSVSEGTGIWDMEVRQLRPVVKVQPNTNTSLKPLIGEDQPYLEKFKPTNSEGLNQREREHLIESLTALVSGNSYSEEKQETETSSFSSEELEVGNCSRQRNRRQDEYYEVDQYQ